MQPEIEAATALLEVWDGELEELAWVAELFFALERKGGDPAGLKTLSALARSVCEKARASHDGREIGLLEQAIARVA